MSRFEKCWKINLSVVVLSCMLLTACQKETGAEIPQGNTEEETVISEEGVAEETVTGYQLNSILIGYSEIKAEEVEQ